MKNGDGHHIIPSPGTGPNAIKFVNSFPLRVECVQYHARLAGLIEAPTRFRLLNAPGVGYQKFSIADNASDNPDGNISVADQVVKPAESCNAPVPMDAFH